MARKDNVDSDGPSTADVSANEDVEMQDQENRMSGFKKFAVSATPRFLSALHDNDLVLVAARSIFEQPS